MMKNRNYFIILSVISIFVIALLLNSLNNPPLNNRMPVSGALSFWDSTIRVEPDSIFLYNTTDPIGNQVPVLHLNLTLQPYYYVYYKKGGLTKVDHPLPESIKEITVVLMEDRYTKFEYPIQLDNSTYKTDDFLKNDTVQSAKYMKERNNNSLNYRLQDGLLSIELNLIKMNSTGKERSLNIYGAFNISVYARLENPYLQDNCQDFEVLEYVDQIIPYYPSQYGKTHY